MSVGYAYIDKYGFPHVSSDKKSAERFAAPGTSVYEYTGSYSGGYATGHGGERQMVDLPGARVYGNAPGTAYADPKYVGGAVGTSTQQPAQQGLTDAQIQQMISNALASQQNMYSQQMAGLAAQMDDMMRRTQAEQAAYQQRLAESERSRQAIEERIARFTSPEFLTEGAAIAREHMRPGQEVDQARIMEAVLRGAEQRGVTHSGITPGLQQKAAQYLDEQYAKKGMDIARDLAMMGVQGAEGEFDRYLQQLGLEHGAMTSGQQMSWNQLANMMGFAQAADRFNRSMSLQEFQAMAPYMLMTQAEKASHVRSLLDQMGVPTGNLTDRELDEIYDSLLSTSGGGF